MNAKSLGAIGVAAALVGAAAYGQDTYIFTVSQTPSTISSNFSATAPFTGSFIGNYDATTNPGGTRTLLGAFGLCSAGNQTVTFSGSGGASGAPMTHPTGTFALRIDTVANRSVLYTLSLDLLGGTQPTVTANANMTYQAFRTCAPTGFFPSLNVPLPLGDAIITRLNATLTCGPAVGTITNTGTGTYTFSVPTTITVDPGVNFNGQDQDTAPVDVPVVITGTVLLGDVVAQATANMNVVYNQVIPGPIPAADNQPFDLPNPLGGTVHLLLDLTLTSVTVDLTTTAALSADGIVTTTPCVADWNHDHIVNSQDFFDFLTAFFSGPADFNCSGTTNSQDFFDFLTAFFAGC